MRMAEFAGAVGLPQDTVRFYIKRGLLQPARGTNGYQIFTPAHVDAVRMIRMGQSLGFSLREITALAREHNAKGMTPARSLEIMSRQLARLEEKAAQLRVMTTYLTAKVAWLKAGSEGPEPRFPHEPTS